MFLTIVTRHMTGRERLFATLKKSLKSQTCQDYEHYIVLDNEMIGVEEANYRLRDVTPIGDYVWVLDDDDVVITPRIIEYAKSFAYANGPDVIMVRMTYAGQLLPGPDCWQGAPIEGQISMQNFIVRADVWNRHKHAFSKRYQADFDFIDSVFAEPNLRVVWFDCIAVADQRGRGLGRPE